MSKSIMRRRYGNESVRRGLISSLVVTGVLVLGAPRDAQAWWIIQPGVYNDQGNWVPDALPIWPADANGIHKIPVCWEAPTQEEINLVYPNSGLTPAPRQEAAEWIQRARRYVENTWARASNIVFTGWGPCSYNMYTEYTEAVRNGDTDRVLLQNGQPSHPERHGLHVELVYASTGTSGFYRGKHGIVRSRMPLDPNTNVKLPWVAVHEFGHSLGFFDEETRSDYCNSYIADGGDTTLDNHCLWAVAQYPLPAEPGPSRSATPDAHSIFAYYKAPPHQYYWGPGPRSELVAEMSTLLSPVDVLGLQTYYGRPAPGTIKGYRGRALTGPESSWSDPVLASLPSNLSRSLWTTEAFESAMCPGTSGTPLEVSTSEDIPGSLVQVRPPLFLGASMRPSVRLAKWRAWGNMCLWAQSAAEGATIMLDYCTSTLATHYQSPFWIEHYQVGNSFQYRLANTNLCASVQNDTYPNAHLVLRTCDMDDDLQLFMKNNQGQLIPRALAGGPNYKCVNVLGGEPRPGNGVGLWPCSIYTPSVNEQFFLTEQLQFFSNEECMDMLNADASLDPAGDPSASVGINRCKGGADAFAWNSTQTWDVYGSGTLTPATRPSLGEGSQPVNLGTGLTDRVTGSKFTIELWVNPDASQRDYANILDFNHRANIGLVIQQDGPNTNRYSFGMGNGTTSCGVTHNLQANRWQHLSLVRDGRTVDLYVDGVLAESAPCFAENVYFLPNSSATVAYNANYDRPFSGRYAGLRLWNWVHYPTTVEVDPDVSLSFNGSSDGMSLGSRLPPLMKGDFTIELMVKPAATQQTYANILDFNHRANVGLVIQQDGPNTNRFGFGIGNGTTSAGLVAQLTADRWQSVAFVRSGALLSLYLDGSLVSQTTGFSDNISLLDGSNATVGYNANFGRYFNGQIKLVRLSRAAKAF